MTQIQMNNDASKYLMDVSAFFDSLNSVKLHEYFDELKDQRIQRWGGGTVEPAVAQLLYCITRLTKPTTVYEFGTNYGYSTYHLLLGIYHNGRGRLHSYDIMSEFTRATKERIQSLHPRAHGRLKLYTESSLNCVSNFWASGVPDLLFIDSSHEYEHTKKELELAQRFMVEKESIICFHDIFSEGVGKALSEFDKKDWDYLEVPTQPNTGFGILRKIR